MKPPIRQWVIATLIVVSAGLLLTIFTNRPERPTVAIARPSSTSTTLLVPPTALTTAAESLKAGPRSLGVELEIPRMGLRSALLSVGMTAGHVMQAPEGGANSPYWDDTFWYRGSSTPGADGTATIAGHVDDVYGRAAAFGNLSLLRPGDLVIIRYTTTGFREEFKVTSMHYLTLAQASTNAALTLIYGSGPPKGLGPQPSADGLAHLSLVTCAGTWNATLATHNERLVVEAIRIL